MPLRSGLAAMIAFAMSADLAWSPPPYWMSTHLDVRLVVLHLVDEAVAALHAGLAEVWSCTTSATLPLSPMSSAMCLAASAAAALLSVAAVVSGMSLSTPESNAMTGMFGVLRLLHAAARRPGCRAPRSRSPPGFLLERVGAASSICCSTSASVGGPSNVMVDAELLGLLLGALLDGLPELVLEALRDDARCTACRRRRRRSRCRPALVGGAAAERERRRARGRDGRHRVLRSNWSTPLC